MTRKKSEVHVLEDNCESSAHLKADTGGPLKRSKSQACRCREKRNNQERNSSNRMV